MGFSGLLGIQKLAHVANMGSVGRCERASQSADHTRLFCMERNLILYGHIQNRSEKFHDDLILTANVGGRLGRLEERERGSYGGARTNILE